MAILSFPSFPLRTNHFCFKSNKRELEVLSSYSLCSAQVTQLHNTVRRANEIELNWPDKRNGEVVLARVGGEMVGIHLLTQTDRQTGQGRIEQDRQDRKGRKDKKPTRVAREES